MPKKIPNSCPACGQQMVISEIKCSGCDTIVRGEFSPTPLGNLTEQQLSFIRTFILARGNIKEVEKRLNISYPTVRAKLDEVIAALSTVTLSGRTKEEILSDLEQGRISAAQAIEELRQLK